MQEPLDSLIKIDAFISTLSEWKEQSSEPLSILLLNQLSSEVIKLRQQNLLHTIPEGDIRSLVSAMHLQIQQSSKSSLKFVDENTVRRLLSNLIQYLFYRLTSNPKTTH